MTIIAKRSFTIECEQYDDKVWFATAFDEQGHIIGVGAGKTGPLDAASNAAIRASNDEYRADQAPVAA